ncbi:MAG: DUF4982 domain-containing protein [Chthoniobacteraceae bacterium]
MFRHLPIRCLLLVTTLLSLVHPASTAPYAVPASGRMTYDFNPGWQFIKQDVPGADAANFDDRKWTTVSTPHTWNDVDSYDEYITRGGEKTLYMGPAWYRKHFKLPASAQGSRVVIEFEGMRQAAKFWVNGKPVGKYEDGVTACGIDITDAVQFGDQDNVLAVWITNATDYKEEATGVVFQWESKDFNPNFGGINRNVRLHILPKIYQTLPLLNGLGTTGTYVYGTNYDVQKQTATVNIESQVKNQSGDQAAVDFSAVVVDAAGNVVAKLQGDPLDMVDGETGTAKASGALTNVRWWSPETPNLYRVYTLLSVDGQVVDVEKTITGFRKTDFKGGASTGGVFINDKFTWLTGWAQRSTDEWAAIGAANPDWLYDFDMTLMKGCNGNYVRWMHTAPTKQDSDACDRVGLVQVCPAGDKEANPKDPVQWNQRVEVMRRTIVYLRNSPSILFWEAGNNGIPANRMQQMVALRKELDPNGGRAMGCRSLPTTAQGDVGSMSADKDSGGPTAGSDANAHVAEYFGVMLAQDPRVDKLTAPSQLFRAFSFERRDLAPFIESEAFREESLRTYWDNYSPPSFGFKKGPNDTYDLNSEQFALAQVKSYNDYWSHRISLTDSKLARWSAYASIVWADSLQLGRNPDTETARSSGKVDAVRIPKQVYFVDRVIQGQKPDLHIIGHWTYPAGTKKTMYVAASKVASVELFLNGHSLGRQSNPTDGFIYTFADVAFAPGSLKAVGYDSARKPLVQHQLKTAGPATAIRLTPHVGPQGLLANGSDVAFFDVEVVDAQGNVCPTDQARIDFALNGPAIWRGGVNEFKPGSINNSYLDTECGVNRVFLRSTLQAGKITLSAKRDGLQSATVTVEAKPVTITHGLVSTAP